MPFETLGSLSTLDVGQATALRSPGPGKQCSSLTCLLTSINTVAARDASAVARNLTGQVLITTDCASTVHESESRGLPVELIDLVVDFAVEDMRTAKDVSAVTVLLHTSSFIRYRAAQAFSPITAWDLGTIDVPDKEPRLRVHPHLVAYIRSLVILSSVGPFGQKACAQCTRASRVRQLRRN